ncbi:hypothetical protein ACQPYE_17780 [Actinosynnema sp. CA-299493]
MTRPRRFRARLRLGLLITLTTASLVTGPVSSSAAPAAGQDTGEVSAEMSQAIAEDQATLDSAGPVQRIRFEFRKNHQDPTRSRLTLYRLTLYKDGPVRRVTLGSWRAGSGIGGNGRGQDPCATSVGWLPNGVYDAHPRETSYRDNFDGGLIFGTVWRLQNKKCAAGTMRTDLFIHSEMTPNRTQACAPGAYRENQCWDGPADYRSEGCIKLKPADIAEAARLALTSGGPRLGEIGYRRLLVVTS